MTETIKRRKCRADHWCTYLRFMICQSSIGRRDGFVYAGETEEGLIKVGKSTRQCPLCRMDQNKLEYLGLVWVPDACVFEQVLITEMGDPVRGEEWFDKPEKIRELIADGWLHDVHELNIKICKMLG